MLRGHAPNKKYGVRFVPQLQRLLGRGLLAAETLREVFTDNAEVLDMVTDEMIAMFVELIRSKGRQAPRHARARAHDSARSATALLALPPTERPSRRVVRQARFVEFLRVLCTNDGKAVRNNQWRVCRMFISEAPELHVRLHLRDAGTRDERVTVSADAQYFPAFVGTGGELEVCEWLDSTSAETAAYFAQLIAVYEVLVQGRNLKNTPQLQQARHTLSSTSSLAIRSPAVRALAWTAAAVRGRRGPHHQPLAAPQAPRRLRAVRHGGARALRRQ